MDAKRESERVRERALLLLLHMLSFKLCLAQVVIGSLGWETCYWCHQWNWNMYIPDGVGGPLCPACLDRFVDGFGREVWWGGQCWYLVWWNVRGQLAEVWMNGKAVEVQNFPLLFPSPLEASAVCYWCSDESMEPEDWCFIDDWPKPLCDRCCHWYACSNGGPYEPRARTRSSKRIGKFFRGLPEAVTETLASFLHAWHEP